MSFKDYYSKPQARSRLKIGEQLHYYVILLIMNMTLSEELLWRGFVNQSTFNDISDLDKAKHKFYWGVDPSASSMTIGNLAAAMMVRVFMKHGYEAVLLVGGATGLIGDPDGKSEERSLKTKEEIDNNKQSIVEQYQTIFGDKQFEVVDNYDWFKDIGYLEFLREVGKHVPMRQMLGREFVQTRLAEDGAGISYAEFSYALIQGYDFLHLFREYGVTMQVAASDQWGNSIAGVELVRRITGGEAHIWTTPLIVNKSTGRKFGKSEEGAVWLDSNLTSVFKFYQFWLNADDEGVEDYLKIYTELDKPAVDEIMKDFNTDRAGRLAQKSLAYEVTKIVHGKERADSVKRVSEVLFEGGSYQSLSRDDISQLKEELPFNELKAGTSIVDVLVTSGLASSKSEARRFLEGNAVYINGQQVDVSKQTLDNEDTLNGFTIIRRGKNTMALIELD